MEQGRVTGIILGDGSALAAPAVVLCTGTFLGGEYKHVTTFSILIAALMIRPYGLFGTVEIERL